MAKVLLRINKTKWVQGKAAKEHVCVSCKKKLKIGSDLVRVERGNAYLYYYCLECFKSEEDINE